jgi:hypothetical protein
MSTMEPSPTSQLGTPELALTNTVENDRPAKAYGDRHFKPVITPGLFKGPILPLWLSKRFRRRKI